MTAVRATLMRYFQPAALLGILALWWLLPEAQASDPFTLLIAVLATPLVVLALEWVSERHAAWRMTWYELAHDLFFVVLSFTAVRFCIDHLAEAGIAEAKASLGLQTLWLQQLPFPVQVAMVLVLIEYGQYWMHRAMHNWHPLWLTHAPHHHLTQLNALKGAVGNPVELFLIGLSIVGLFDFSLTAVFCAAHMLAAIGSFAHANVRFDPPRWYSFLFTTIEHHSLHHSLDYEATRSNYANCLILIDRLHGTFRAGEGVLLGQEGGRLTVGGIMLYTFMPIINALRGGRRPA
ncbi:sterol desaturase family protein [Sandarakinorhabdus rubra]|uniref:sterol desaturase family protein n=1 Tax=Sandarakinorhabdus rubra TaxID=2672568 RepID=UPI0013D94D60|nr:sterol desaturase family protein [Sandarakinorhabdus rubra]